MMIIGHVLISVRREVGSMLFLNSSHVLRSRSRGKAGLKEIAEMPEVRDNQSSRRFRRVLDKAKAAFKFNGQTTAAFLPGSYS